MSVAGGPKDVRVVAAGDDGYSENVATSSSLETKKFYLKIFGKFI